MALQRKRTFLDVTKLLIFLLIVIKSIKIHLYLYLKRISFYNQKYI